MQETNQDTPCGDERVLVRWLPSVLLDLPPGEAIIALRTPHRVSLQAVPRTREGLASLLSRPEFELVLELEDEAAPLKHVPIHEVHEARLAPDLPLDWPQYYWTVDGLADDLAEGAADPAAAFLRGRTRLAVVEAVLRDAMSAGDCDLHSLDTAWALPRPTRSPDVERYGDPSQALQQYVRGFAGHLAEHSGSQPFADEARSLLALAEKRREVALPALGTAEIRTLSLYAQHRLFGSPHFAAPAGMIAGWQLLFSAQAVAVWWTGLLLRSRRETRAREALMHSLALLDQGLWRDEPLVHDVLRHLNASEYTSLGLAVTLASALRGAPARS
jgi:hypothetical protein